MNLPVGDAISKMLRAGLGVSMDETHVLIALTNDTEIILDENHDPVNCPVCHRALYDCEILGCVDHEELTVLDVHCAHVPKDGTVFPVELLA